MISAWNSPQAGITWEGGILSSPHCPPRGAAVALQLNISSADQTNQALSLLYQPFWKQDAAARRHLTAPNCIWGAAAEGTASSSFPLDPTGITVALCMAVRPFLFFSHRRAQAHGTQQPASIRAEPSNAPQPTATPHLSIQLHRPAHPTFSCVQAQYSPLKMTPAWPLAPIHLPPPQHTPQGSALETFHGSQPPHDFQHCKSHWCLQL